MMWAWLENLGYHPLGSFRQELSFPSFSTKTAPAPPPSRLGWSWLLSNLSKPKPGWRWGQLENHWFGSHLSKLIAIDCFIFPVMIIVLREDINRKNGYFRVYPSGMCGAELFPAGRGKDKNPRGGAKVKIRGAGQKNA